MINRTSYGGQRGDFSARGSEFFKIYFAAGVLFGVACFLYILVLFAVAPSPQDISILMIVPIYASYLFTFAYIQSRLGNLIWNRTRVGPLYFRSTLGGRSMATLYLTNLLAIATSAGLLTPWAVMRTLRYRTNNTRVFRTDTLMFFAGNNVSSVKATAAEIGEFFDLDFSI